MIKACKILAVCQKNSITSWQQQPGGKRINGEEKYRKIHKIRRKEEQVLEHLKSIERQDVR